MCIILSDVGRDRSVSTVRKSRENTKLHSGTEAGVANLSVYLVEKIKSSFMCVVGHGSSVYFPWFTQSMLGLVQFAQTYLKSHSCGM